MNWNKSSFKTFLQIIFSLHILWKTHFPFDFPINQLQFVLVFVFLYQTKCQFAHFYFISFERLIGKLNKAICRVSNFSQAHFEHVDCMKLWKCIKQSIHIYPKYQSVGTFAYERLNVKYERKKITKISHIHIKPKNQLSKEFEWKTTLWSIETLYLVFTIYYYYAQYANAHNNIIEMFHTAFEQKIKKKNAWKCTLHKHIIRFHFL